MFGYFINSLIFFSLATMVLYSSEEKSTILNWQIVDDVVMGGRSNGNFQYDEKGHGVFSGNVSLENNGGFSSLRCRLDPIKMEKFSKVVLKVKGDGKSYQFRIKSSAYERHSYIAHFQTDGSWQTIEITLSDMYPAFRGRKLDMSNYAGKELEEFAFLISNKKAESFRLLLDKISLE